MIPDESSVFCYFAVTGWSIFREYTFPLATCDSSH